LAANTATLRDANAGRAALKRTEHELSLSPEVESRPIDVLKVFRHKSGHIGKVRQPIPLAI
jgi:hypothetical protein